MDWWTLGILIYEMIVGQPPFCDEEPMGIYQKILAGKIYFPKYFDKNAKALVKKLVTADLSKRYGNLKAGSADVSWLFFLDSVQFNRARDRRLDRHGWVGQLQWHGSELLLCTCGGLLRRDLILTRCLRGD